MTKKSTGQQVGGKIKVGFGQALKMIVPFAGLKIWEQIKSVWIIITYLILFLWLVLRMPVSSASIIALGLAGVVVGLAFFMEGLLLGLMPLGEVIGLKLPQKAGLVTILGFAAILGIGATFAEPAIGVLKAAGSTVSPWESPLLFTLLNKHSSHLVYAVALGVGIAVMFGMLRFMYDLSLKPFIYVLVGGLCLMTAFGAANSNLRDIMGLAWDCGAVTTGPVTVPLVLALGIGICRVVGRAGAGNAGFGVVTLASLFPVLAVMLLGFVLYPSVGPPRPESDFYARENRAQAEALFEGRPAMLSHAFWNANPRNQARLFEGGEQEMLEYLHSLTENEAERKLVFGPKPDALFRWAVQRGTQAQRATVFGGEGGVKQGIATYGVQPAVFDVKDLLRRNGLAAVQAIIPLTLFLTLVLLFIIREKIPRADEVILGVIFALIGMGFINIGIETGLGRLGTQVGGKLPALFKSIEMPDQVSAIENFDPEVVQTAVKSNGQHKQFFYRERHGSFEPLPYEPQGYDPVSKRYVYTPSSGPLFGMGQAGKIVLLVFAFLLGYGATLAEPALNALGHTVEEMTVGTFKKFLLMQSVALGVGAGILVGIVKIIWSVPLAWLLVPPYVLLLILTFFSTEEYVNIGWDSAGVTTGPVTVPLVLAMGLGIGGQLGVTEGFGVLAMASACPILTVLAVGLYVNRQRRADLTGEAAAVQGDIQ
ncbi:MAG: DUF1538 domain-containing protein [Pseudomonadota bacterium]